MSLDVQVHLMVLQVYSGSCPSNDSAKELKSIVNMHTDGKYILSQQTSFMRRAGGSLETNAKIPCIRICITHEFPLQISGEFQYGISCPNTVTTPTHTLKVSITTSCVSFRKSLIPQCSVVWRSADGL